MCQTPPQGFPFPTAEIQSAGFIPILDDVLGIECAWEILNTVSFILPPSLPLYLVPCPYSGIVNATGWQGAVERERTDGV
jgi:hypothetical protein